MTYSLQGDVWQVILVQEGVSMWQVQIDMASGQVLRLSPVGQGNG